MRRADLPIIDLQELLADAFAPAELDRLVLGLPGAEGWRASLPISSGSRAEHAARIVAFLLDRGRIDGALLQAIREERPSRAPELDALNLVGINPPTDLPPQLAALREHARERTRLPRFFYVPGGPDAYAEVEVELSLTTEAQSDKPSAPFLHAHAAADRALCFDEDLPSGRFPLRRLLHLPRDRWMVLGVPGSGKTTCLRRFARQIAEEGALVPLLLRVTELADVAAALESRSPGCGPAFWAAAARGEVVLLVDGLDEAVHPEAAHAALAALSSRLGPSRLIVTSRSAGYEPLGGRWQDLRLCELSRPQQEELLRRWLPKERHGEISGQLDGLSPRMAALAGNPLILTLMAKLLRGPVMPSARPGPAPKLPGRRVDLYRQVVDGLLRVEHDPRAAPARRLERSAGAVSALGWLALHDFDDEDDQLTLAAVNARLDTAPARVQEAAGGRDAEPWLTKVVQGTGLLEEGVPGAWTFAHRTFREYLAACALRDDVQARSGVAKCGINSELDRRLTEAKAKPALWAEVFALLTGLLAGGEAGALVKRLVDGGTDYKPLLFRLLADAEGLKEETVWGVLGLAAGRDEWERRVEVLQGLPALVGDQGVAVKLLGRFGKAATHGADLWWAHHLLVEIATGRLGDGDEEARAEASELAARLFRDHRQDGRRRALDLIKAKGWWKAIPAWRFKMGSTPQTDPDRYADEGPQHYVEIVRGFELLAVPVTNELYELFDPRHAEDKSNFSGELPLTEQELVPVYRVSWYEASAFAAWLGCRLPSETEWEYACRGGKSTRFWSGSKDQDLFDVDWVSENSGNHPHPVATPPTERGAQHPWGLQDLHGNVWEWCVDPRLANYQGRESGITFDSIHLILNENPAPPRVIRGGSWVVGPRNARSAYRSVRLPAFRDAVLGFRLLRPLPESGK